ncbi:polysaccharide deacetylase family protein [Candidatus Omnitrophota bacterium]
MFSIIKTGIANTFYHLKRFKLCEGSVQPGSFRILLYHAVAEVDSQDRLGLKVSLRDFTDQMDYLHKEGYSVLPLQELVFMLRQGRFIPPKAVSLTFDDGYRDNLEQILAVLKKYDYKATFFVIGDSTGNKAKYPKKDYWDYWDCFSLEDLRKVAREGSDIGLHSYVHENLLKLAMLKIEQNISKAKNTLEVILRKRIGLFSYPHGGSNAKVIEILRECGFKAACSSIPGYNHGGTNLFMLHRTEINTRDGISGFKKKLSGCYDWRGYFRGRDVR